MNQSKEETEVSINFTDADRTASIYCCNQAWIRKLDKLCIDFPDQFRLHKQDEYSKWYYIPKKYIRIGKPISISDEQRAAAKERARGLRK
jgi:N-acetyl-gamma-glutamylphosphate reductase